jgi:MFS family permease
MAAFVMSLVFLPPASVEPRPARTEEGASYRLLLGRPRVLGMMFFMLGYTVCIGALWGFLPLLASTRFSLSSSETGLLIMTGVLVSGVLQTPMGYLADRHDKRVLAAFGGFLIAASMFSIEFAHGFSGLLYCSLCYGIGGGIAMPSLMALGVLEGRRAGQMGAVMGLLAMSNSLGTLLGSVAAGLIMDFRSLSSAYSASGVFMFFTIFLFVFFCREGRTKRGAPKTGAPPF